MQEFSIRGSIQRDADRSAMKISARNQLKGTVQGITRGEVSSEVTLVLASGERIVAVITSSSVDSLGLNDHAAAYAIIKASEVIVGKGMDASRLSARNVLAGKVTGIIDGPVNSEVSIELSGGGVIVASITRYSAHALELRIDDQVSAIVKASNVIVGV